MNTTDRILRVDSLTKTYGKGGNKTEALRGITFDVREGEFLGIMGASGSGKTTLLNCIATMIRPTSGKVILRGQDISEFRGSRLADYRGRIIGYLFQEFELLDNLTARENITLPLALHGKTAREAEGKMRKLASMLDIAGVLDQFPSQLSGGQKQRVAAARAFIANPDLVLADEPTGALDSKNSKILMDQLASVNRELGKTIMMVTHDANAASYCSRILFIQDGRVFHELRRHTEKESTAAFYERIVTVTAQLGGGGANVL
ncbi:ABC transporter ATP-binding protein [Cuneatibacter sp. NSJ-177]|uniref:ABC transporter ATP-binding protein n=1 Tax=Cuneatibacter sp. NSJ-177 TaxID=2931401 RepID=UPI001FD2AD73|nr:ABC transporter ATP-binding protein [Cuneatibacter sp. NSJ-177]MCJ7836655.1 ABC transporter ATP-binding protein [Cuneatibacter sp. NSJ-177]